MLLLRHASAGDRLSSASLDRARRLDRIGRADARELPHALLEHDIDRIVSSPLARCTETVGALARGRNLRVQERPELLPDASLDDLRRLLAELPESALVCTHREVIAKLLPDVSCEKGGAWQLERRDDNWSPVAYFPPPSALAGAFPAFA